jgi:hypothetical protein
VRIRLAIAGGGGLMQVETFDPLRAAASISTVSKRGVCAAAALFHAGHGGQSIVRPPQRLGPGELLLVRLIGLRGCELVGDHAEPVSDTAEPKDFLWADQDAAFVGIIVLIIEGLCGVGFAGRASRGLRGVSFASSSAARTSTSSVSTIHSPPVHSIAS